ncbi:hypothetical protein Trydic_g15839 [Trypoxylus dichotomus]
MQPPPELKKICDMLETSKEGSTTGGKRLQNYLEDDHTDVDVPVSDVDKIAKVLGSLPPKYGVFITAWNSYNETKPSWCHVPYYQPIFHCNNNSNQNVID